MIQRIKFKGKDYVFVAGAIATEEQYKNCMESYAHLFDDGIILRHGKEIGTKEDIEFLDEVEDSELITEGQALNNVIQLLDKGFTDASKA